MDAAANGHGEVATHGDRIATNGKELQGVEKLRAVSDFAPINTRVKRCVIRRPVDSHLEHGRNVETSCFSSSSRTADTNQRCRDPLAGVSVLSDRPLQVPLLAGRLRLSLTGTPPWSFYLCRSYHLFRYPILFFLLFIIYAEFSCYVMTRQVVNVFEYVVAWTGHKRVLRRQMRRAGTWREWVAAAKEMDEYLGFEAWKAVRSHGFLAGAEDSRSSCGCG